MDIKINKPFPGYNVDQLVMVQTDSEGTPLDFFWRRRLKDAKTDNCCEIVKSATKKVVVSDKKENK